MRSFLCASWLAWGLAAPAIAQPRYVVNDLGTLGGSSSTAAAINNNGQVVGQSVNASGFNHAFRTAPGAAINPATDDLGTLGGSVSQATGINDSGQVSGSSPLSGFFGLHAFRTAPNSAINPATDDLGALADSPLATVGTGVNASGQVSGYGAISVPNQTRAFRTGAEAGINAATDDLGCLCPNPSEFFIIRAFGLNNLGQAVGDSTTTVNGLNPNAFRTAPNSPINPLTDNLGTLGGATSTATAINDSGQVVGASTDSAGRTHAFRTAPGAAINPVTDDLGTLGGAFSSAAAINNSGQVVGSSNNASSQNLAFLYTGGVMYDLNTLIQPGSGWTLQNATGVNNLGQIAGNGLVNGAQHAFRLDPVSFPALMNSLLSVVGSMGLPPGTSQDLSATLRASMDAMERGNYTAAQNQLKAFENKVHAQAGKSLTSAQAGQLLGLAAEAMQMLP